MQWDDLDPELIAIAVKAISAAKKQRETSLTVAQVWAKHADWGATNIKSWSSNELHWRCHLLEFFGERQVSTLGLSDADAYRAWRAKQSCSSTTRNHELSTMRACFNWAVRRKLIPENPLAGMDMEPNAPVENVFLEEADFAKLLLASPKAMGRIIFTVAYDTGMRQGELLHLRWKDVDLDTQLIRLGDGDVKNGTGRIVPLTDRAWAALREAPRWSQWVFTTADGSRLPKSTLLDWFEIARDKADLPKALTFHKLRHSCATLMRRRKVPWPLIKAALGWKSDVAAKRYQNYNEEDWLQLRTNMNEGIAKENRRGPLRTVPDGKADRSDEKTDMSGAHLITGQKKSNTTFEK